MEVATARARGITVLVTTLVLSVLVGGCERSDPDGPTAVPRPAPSASGAPTVSAWPSTSPTPTAFELALELGRVTGSGIVV